MHKFAQLNYDNFSIIGEVNERLPQYNNDIQNIYPLDNNDSTMPLLKLESNKISIGSSASLIHTSNVQLLNGDMRFTGNDDSYNTVNIGYFNMLEFYFNIESLTKTLTLFQSENGNLKIKINHVSKYIYVEMPQLNDKISVKPDFENGGVRLTADNSVTTNTWYRLRMYKYNSIISIILNDTVTRTFIYKKDESIGNAYIGKGFTGKMKYFSYYKDNENSKISETLPNAFSLTLDLCFTSSNTIDLLTLSPLTLNISNTTLSIKNGSSVLSSCNITLNRKYSFACSYSGTTLTIIIRDLKADTLIMDTTLNVTLSKTLSASSNGMTHNLVIYNKSYSKDFLCKLNKKRFSLNKEGNILYELDETDGHNKLKYNGRKYHMQLTMDLNSDCETITNSTKANFVYGGAESKSENAKLKLLFANKIGLSNTWDFIYKTKITSLTNGKHYDSLGEGLYWGIEDNKFAIKYIQGQSILSSFVDNVNASEFLNEWIMLSLTYSSSNVTLTIFTSKGIFSTSISKTIGSITNGYDIFFGGKEDSLFGEAIYRDFTIINGWNVDLIYKENMFRTKFSYDNHKFISNVDIVELT